MNQIPLHNFPTNSKWSQYQLDKAGFEVFFLLQRDPTAPVSKLAEQLGYSTTLVNSRLDYLKEQNFLRPDRKIIVPYLGERQQSASEVVYNPNSLGLTRYHVFLTGIPDIGSWNYLETLLAIHPYSHYHISSFADKATLYCQFDIPPDGIKYLNMLFEKLHQDDYFQSISSLDQKIMVRSDFDFTHWEFSTNRWELFREHEFSETSFDTELDFLWRDFSSIGNTFEPSESPPTMDFKFDKIDMKLLRELTVNANLNISNLSQHYTISRSRISRRINRLRDLVVKNERLVFDKSIFNLTTGQIIHGTFQETDEFNAKRFYNFLDSDYLPFSTTAVIDDPDFIWFTMTPPEIIPQINRFVWQHATNISIYPLDITTGRTYFFNHQNLEEKGKWQISREYILDQPIQNMEKLGNN